MIAELLDGIAWAAAWLWAMKYHWLALAAGGYSAYALDQVLVRLDRGGHEPVGRRITWLALALVVMLVAAHNAYDDINVSYGAIAVVLAAGVVAWVARLGTRSAPEPRSGSRRASFFLLQACALLLAVLWLVQRAFEKFTPDTGSPSELLATFGGAGLLAMAMVQGLRTLLPLRGVFHRLALERWIVDSRDGDSARSAVKSPKRILAAITGLARGPVGGEQHALLDLPIEQLCGQIAAGADRLLDEPVEETLAGRRAKEEDRATVREVLTVLTAGSKDVKLYLRLAKDVAAAMKQSSSEPPSDSREYVRLRANLSQRIQRNIDGLQISTTFWWRRVLRGLAFTISGVLGLSVFKGDPTFSVVCAIVGGFVATASRDLIAVVEKARR